MTQVELFTKEMASEGKTTRKMLSVVPNDRFDWKPHPKSMNIRQLTTHIAELPGWPGMVLHSDGLDFATMDYNPTPLNSKAELMDIFEKNLSNGLIELTKADESSLDKTWTLRTGDQIHSADTKAAMIRITISQIIHHRAQLGVYLRLLDIPIPGSYGPSADDNNF